MWRPSPVVFLLLVIAFIIPHVLSVSPYLTSVLDNYKTDTVALASFVGSGGLIFTQVTFAASFSTTPDIALALCNMIYQPPQSSSSSWSSLSYQLSVLDKNSTAFTLQVDYSNDNIFQLLEVSYLGVTTTNLFDIRTTLHDFTSTSISSQSASSRTTTITISYSSKSNTSNAIALFFTIGYDASWTNSAFGYSLSLGSYESIQYNLQLTVAANSSINLLYLCTVNYEQTVIQVSVPVYLDVLITSTSSSGSIVDSSTVTFASGSKIFTGLAYLGFIDTSNSQFAISFTNLNYNIISNNINQFALNALWLREQTCGNNFYLDTLSQTCTSCHYSCTTCTDSLDVGCLSCSNTNFRSYVSTNNSCPCANGYYNAGFAVCAVITCSYSCNTCANLNQCGSCSSTNHRTLSGTTCPCDIGFYDDGTNAMCGTCHRTCYKCSGGSTANNCTQCLSTNFRVYRSSDSTCQCMTKYYDSGSGSSCLACQYSCATCINFTNCLTCNSLKNRVQAVAGTGYCQCSSGTYDDLINQNCVTCNYKCTTCNKSQCLTCDSTRTLTSGSCVCNTGYYDDGVNTVCPSCHYSCKTCTNSSSCASCDSTKMRTFNTSVSNYCICAIKYYDDGSSQTCNSCHATCAKCTGSYGTDTCTSCNATAQRYLDVPTGNTGHCLCMARYYQVDPSVQECSACYFKCYTCSNPTTCDSCDASKFRSGATCNCMSGYYQNNTDSCVACPYYCLTCSSDSACDTCHSTRDSTATTYLCPCLTGYYDDGSSTACLACSVTCKTCSSASTNCTTCDSIKLRTINNLYQCACNSRAYEASPVQAACYPCLYSCLTCNTGSTCLTCNATAKRVWNSATSNCDCMTGYYSDGTNELCIACHYSCKTCTSGAACSSCDLTLGRVSNSSTNLCSCTNGYYDTLTQQQCAYCHYTCQTCTNSTECVTCDSTKYRNSTLNSTTKLCSCQTGFYDDGVSQLCTGCSANCLTCASSLGCASCDSSKFRYLSSLNCLCMTGYYDSGSTTCTACSYTCVTCTSSASCTTCSASNYRQLNVYCDCMQGFYDTGLNQQLCLPCMTSCETCTSATTCSTCNLGTNHRSLNGSNQCACITGYYDAGYASCQLCHYSCLTCSTSSYQCDTCDIAQYRTTDSSTGLCKCVDYYYNSGTNPTCQSCHYTCLTCSSSSQSSCLTCLALSLRILSAGKCTCSTNTYDDGTNIQCISCDYKCKTCSNPTTCLTCDSTKNRVFNSTTSNCDCAARYYDDGTNQACGTCPYYCATCSSSTTCLTCSSLKYRTLDNSNVCACMTGYYDDGTNQLCAKCHYTCYTCISGAACSSCNPSNFRNTTLLGSLCSCIAGFYDDGSNTTCKACPYHCTTCTMGSGCTTCSATAFRSLSTALQCVCNTGYFDNNTNSQTCNPCSYKCATCSNTATNCTSCTTSNLRTYSSGNCLCNQRFFDDGTNSLCQPCSYSCASCTNISACLTCDSAKFRLFNSTTSFCSCMTKYFQTSGVELCTACAYDCATCSSAGACDTCSSTDHRTLNSSSRCACDQHYFDSLASTCSSCLYYCDSCSNAITCVTCNATRNRVFNTSTSQCQCLPFFYDSGLNSETCLACHYSCASCTNGSSCATCDSSLRRSLLLPPALCSCVAPYFDDGVNAQCQSCHYTCKTCTNSSACVSCDGLKYRVVNSTTKICDCLAGYYSDGINQQCLPCHYSCTTCSDSNTCNTCSSLYFRTFSANSCVCAQHYYDDSTNILCLACHYSCSTCSSSSVCSTCNSTKFRTQSGLTCACMTGYYDNGASQICLPCSYKCVTCQSSSTCSSCNSAMFRDSNIACSCTAKYWDDGSNALCKSCQYTCATCTNATQCVSCNPTKYRTTNSTTGLCSCKQQYYDDGTSELCQPCQYTCLTCSNSYNCITCDSTKYRTLSGTQCLCDQHYYDDLVNTLCATCDYRCSSCSQATSCDTCNATKFRTINLATGFCDCIDGYYDSGTSQETCLLCNPSCKTCSSGLSCDTCEPSDFRQLNSTTDVTGYSSPYCVCFYRYYPSTSSVCAPCHYSCEVCSSPGTVCNYCNATAHRILNTSKCLCLDGYYDDGIQELCKACDFKCLKCTWSNAQNCTKCDTTFYLYLPNTTCYVNCPSRYYNDTATMTCVACPSNCLVCSNSTRCTQCENSYYLNGTFNVNCVQTCPTKYYANVSLGTCMNCLDNCSTCTGLYVCSGCLDGFYLDSVDKLCYSCHTSCGNCTGPGGDQCSSCNYPLFQAGTTCTRLVCNPDSYVHPTLGCTKCSVTYPYAATCNISTVLSCLPTYIIDDILNKCLTCGSVSGFYQDSLGACRQICGDGKRYSLACDDGNTIDGDGCSSTCNLEEGWNCTTGNSVSSTSCSLAVHVTLTINKITKIAGQNKIDIEIKTSIPLRLKKQDFNLSIPGVKLDIDVVIVSSTVSRLILSYTASVQNTKLIIKISPSFSRRRLLSTRHLASSSGAQISITIPINTYPPANYYPQQTISTVSSVNRGLKAISIVTVAAAFLALVFGTRRVAFYLIDPIHIIAFVYITQTFSLNGRMEWIFSAISGLKECALIGGFSFSNCNCPLPSFYQSYGIENQFLANAGSLLIVLAFGIVTCSILMAMCKIFKWEQGTNIHKLAYYSRYYLMILGLAFSPIILWSAFIQLCNPSLASTTSSLNMFFSVMSLCGIIVYWLFLFKWVRKANAVLPTSAKDESVMSDRNSPVYFKKQGLSERSKANNQQNNNQTKSHQITIFDDPNSVGNNLAHDNLSENRTVRSRSDHSDTRVNVDIDSPKYFDKLPFEFTTLFSDSKLSRFYPILESVRCLFTAIIVNALSSYNTARSLCLLGINLLYIPLILILKPYKARVDNLRILLVLILQVIIVLLDTILLSLSNYIFQVEVALIVMLSLLLIFNIVMFGAQIIYAYRKQIHDFIYPCILKFKFSKKSQTTVKPAVPSQRQSVVIESLVQMDEARVATPVVQEEPSEIDMFFQRVMKKNRINKEYRKARMMRNPK